MISLAGKTFMIHISNRPFLLNLRKVLKLAADFKCPICHTAAQAFFLCIYIRLKLLPETATP
jgi:hypothetical protein